MQINLRYLDTAWVEPEEERRVKWDPELTRALAFGFEPTMIDWLWMNALLDSNLSKVAQGTHPQLYYDLDLITDLDGAFLEVYITGGNLLAVIRSDGLGARSLLLKGVEYFKKSAPEYLVSSEVNYEHRIWNLYLVLAYVHLFELNDMKEASLSFQKAAAQPHAPGYLGRLSTRLQKPGGEYEVGLRLLSFLIEGAKDSKIRTELQNKWDNLNKSYFIYQLDQKFQEFQKNAKSSGARHHSKFLPGQVESLWKKFLLTSQTRAVDPWGGQLSVNESGHVETTTPRSAVFGLH